MTQTLTDERPQITAADDMPDTGSSYEQMWETLRRDRTSAAQWLADIFQQEVGRRRWVQARELAIQLTGIIRSLEIMDGIEQSFSRHRSFPDS